MNFRLVLGYILTINGSGLAATCAVAQGITELRPFNPYLLWVIPVGLLIALAGLVLVVRGEQET